MMAICNLGTQPRVVSEKSKLMSMLGTVTGTSDRAVKVALESAPASAHPSERFADVAPPVANVALVGNAPRAHVHIPALDGIRGLAILLVLFFHFMLVEGDSSVVRLIQKTWGFGWMGVDLFFVLSGFLITGILFDAKSRPNYF